MCVMGRLYLRLWGVKYGKGLRMYSLPLCRRDRGAVIEIGAGVSIKNKLSENLAGAQHRTVIAATQPGARLIIGDYVGLSGVILNSAHEIIIEDNVALGTGVRVYDTDFHPVDAVARRKCDSNEILTKSVRICEDVWVGTNVIILKGVTIGPRCVVGAGAVVTRSCPADTLVGGVPARVIRELKRSGR